MNDPAGCGDDGEDVVDEAVALEQRSGLVQCLDCDLDDAARGSLIEVGVPRAPPAGAESMMAQTTATRLPPWASPLPQSPRDAKNWPAIHFWA